MKKNLLPFLITALMGMVGAKAFAYDIAVENTDGVTLYYNYINNGKELEVTNKANDYTYYYSIYGDFSIPAEVTYMNRTRKVTSIGDDAFFCCSGLTSITIPNSVRSIGDYAFANCSGLTSVTIPNSVTKIGENAFDDCTSMTSVTIPNSVTKIGKNAFYNCTSLTSVFITDLAAWCNMSFDDNPLNYAHHLYLNGEEIKDLVIPNGVTSLVDRAFLGCSGLTSVTIPNSVTSIEKFAFSQCSGLTSVKIGNSVTSIGDYAFANCSGLTSVTIPNSVTKIGENAFDDCTGLTSITIPNSVTSIEKSTFEGCTGLTSITIPNSVTSIGNSAFKCCSLTSVTIPKNVTSIGNEAFSCGDIPEVISKIENPFNIPTNTFNDNTFYNATLYVPEGTINFYNATEGWNKFFFIEEVNGSVDDLVAGDANGDGIVNAADIVEAVNAMNGHPSVNYKDKNADMDGNSEVEEADIEAIVKIIMNQ